MTAPRTKDGRFLPGVSGNPKGKPKGSAGLAAFIAKKTRDGRLLANEMLAILVNPKSTPEQKLAATKWLGDRAFGRSETTATLNVNADVTARRGEPGSFDAAPTLWKLAAIDLFKRMHEGLEPTALPPADAAEPTADDVIEVVPAEPAQVEP